MAAVSQTVRVVGGRHANPSLRISRGYEKMAANEGDKRRPGVSRLTAQPGLMEPNNQVGLFVKPSRGGVSRPGRALAGNSQERLLLLLGVNTSCHVISSHLSLWNPPTDLDKEPKFRPVDGPTAGRAGRGSASSSGVHLSYSRLFVSAVSSSERNPSRTLVKVSNEMP